jgi:sulfofructose kinase
VAERPVICLGSAVWDTIFQVEDIPTAGIKVLPSRALQIASGMATSAAITIARLGGNVQLWSRVGDDDIARRFIRDVQGEGVDTGFVHMQPGLTTPFSTVIVDKMGERLVVPYFDPNMSADTSWLPLDRIAGAGAVLADMRWVDGAVALFQTAKSHGIPAILDADTAPHLDLARLVPMASHVLFSEVALRSYVTASSPEEALMTVAQNVGAKVLGVTLGAKGSLIWTRDAGTLQHYSTPKIVATDTLNAGDVWHGTFAWGLAQGWLIERIVPAANLAAAMKCEVFGGRLGTPTLQALQQRAQSLGLGVWPT